MTAKPKTRGAAFRAEIDDQFYPPDPYQRVVLDELCRLLDEVEQMEAVLARDGMTSVGGNGQVSAHPLVAGSRQHALAIAKLCHELGLANETPGSRQARKAAVARWAK